MKFNYQSHSLKPGIYKITNTHTGRIYVGQAKEFKSRWKSHASSLRNGKHHNKFLQNDYNKCKEELGNDDFIIFEVIEVMEGSTKQERNDKEEAIIASFFDKCNTCYNFNKKVESNPRTCYSKTPEETSKKISENSKLNWTQPGFKERHIKSMQEFYSKQENLDKHSEMLKVRWSDESYKTKVVDKLKEAWANKPKEDRIKQMQKAQIVIEEKREKEKTLKGIVISPDGIEYEVYHVRTFVKEHGLENNRAQLIKVLNGTRDTCKGWRNKTPRVTMVSKPRKNYVHTIQSPDGNIYCITFLKKFIRDNAHLGLKYTGLHGLVNGTIDEYKGWKRYIQTTEKLLTY